MKKNYSMISIRLNISRCILFVFIINLLFLNVLYSQTEKKVDKIIDSVVNDIYSNPDKVIKFGEALVSKAGDNVHTKIKGYILISDAYSSKRDYEKSSEYVIKANQLLPLTNDMLMKIWILNKTGVQYQQMNIYEKAIQYLDQAEQFIEAYPYKDSIHDALGVNYVVKGIVYKEKKAYDIAIIFFDKAVTELLKSKSKGGYGNVSVCKYNKGNCCMALKKNQLAIKNFDEAFDYAKAVNAKTLRAFALKGKAQVYMCENNYPLAIQILREALFYASGVNDLVLHREIYKELSQNYLAVDNLTEYKTCYLNYLKVKEEINSNERKSISISLDKKNKELKKDFGRKMINFYWLYSILLLLIIVLIILLQIQTKKRLKNIEIKKKEIELLLTQNEKHVE